MSKYQLPCSCGAIIPVSMAQAGTTATCQQCNAIVDIPTTRELRLLAPVETADAGGKKSRSAGSSGGAVRGIAAVLLLISLCCFSYGGYLVYERSTSGVKFSDKEDLLYDEHRKVVESMPPVVIWDHWHDIIDFGLPKPKPHPYFATIRYLESKWPWLLGSFVVGTASLLGFAGISWSLSRKS